MDLFTTVMLVVSGLFGGVLSTMVGGAAVIVYPALVASGVPPHLAAACNLTALMPGSLVAALSDRSQLPPFDRAFFGLIAASVVGAGLGAAALVFTSERTFAVLVPLLLGFATVMFAFADRISAWLRRRAADRGHPLEFNLTSLRLVLPVSFYSGYFGAGAGILMLGVFTLATDGDYRAANVTKNLVSGLNGVVGTLVFVVNGALVWPQTLAVMAGMIGGGYLGARIARVIPRHIVRVLIVVLGAALTVEFARRYWF